MISFRKFHNTDPPRIRNLWQDCQLGRGAAGGLTCDAFELVIFGQPYFEREGCILACDGDKVVGMVLSGFAVNEQQNGLDTTRGVICAVLVHPEHRRRGIGRKLVDHAISFLRGRGASQILAGGGPGFNPFLVGMYGGSQPAGFLASDSAADPFFQTLGFSVRERHDVYTRNL